MTHAHAQKMVEQRRDMLASVARDISPALLHALEKKIEYEHQSLVAMIESDAKTEAVRKELNKTLKSEYFIQKKLDISLI